MLVPVNDLPLLLLSSNNPLLSKLSLRPASLFIILFHKAFLFCQYPCFVSNTENGGIKNCSLNFPSHSLYLSSKFIESIFDKSNPKSLISMLSISSSSTLSKLKSHSDFSATLLSANLKALICSSVKSSAIIQGTTSKFNCFAALYLVCPATITLSVSITIGTLNPNSLILLATSFTAESFFLGFFSYGFSSEILTLLIYILYLHKIIYINKSVTYNFVNYNL